MAEFRYRQALKAINVLYLIDVKVIGQGYEVKNIPMGMSMEFLLEIIDDSMDRAAEEVTHEYSDVGCFQNICGFFFVLV